MQLFDAVQKHLKKLIHIKRSEREHGKKFFFQIHMIHSKESPGNKSGQFNVDFGDFCLAANTRIQSNSHCVSVTDRYSSWRVLL